MPLYEFSCIDCSHVFEDLRSFKDQNPNCPKCDGKTKKLISRFFGIVKGSEHRSLDCLVGEDSEKKWKAIEKRKERRLKKRLEKQKSKKKEK